MSRAIEVALTIACPNRSYTAVGCAGATFEFQEADSRRLTLIYGCICVNQAKSASSVIVEII